MDKAMSELQDRVAALDDRLQQLAGDDKERAAELRRLLADLVQSVTALLTRRHQEAVEVSEEELDRIRPEAVGRAVAITTTMLHGEDPLEADPLFLDAYRTHVGEDATGVLAGMMAMTLRLLDQLAGATGRSAQEILQQIAQESAEMDL